MRVYFVRHHHQLPAHYPNQCNPSGVNLDQAAQRLNLSPPSVRKLIDEKILPGYQVVECAPWQIPIEALDMEIVQKAAANPSVVSQTLLYIWRFFPESPLGLRSKQRL